MAAHAVALHQWLLSAALAGFLISYVAGELGGTAASGVSTSAAGIHACPSRSVLWPSVTPAPFAPPLATHCLPTTAHAGVAFMLAELGIITPAVPLAGASSGALVATAMCSGTSARQLSALVTELSAHCRASHNCQGTLDTAVRQAMRELLAGERYARCNGIAYISISVGAFPPRSGSTRNVLASQFASGADLADAAAASSYIPLWSGEALQGAACTGRASLLLLLLQMPGDADAAAANTGKNYTTTFRGQPAFDGFFTNEQPCPPGVTYCVRINSRTPSWSRARMSQFFSLVGRAATRGTGKPARLAAVPPGGFSAVLEAGSRLNVTAFEQAAADGVDISPGVFSNTGMSLDAWSELVVLPGDKALNEHLYGLGRADAKAWATATGLADAAAARSAALRVAAALPPRLKAEREVQG